MTTSSEPATGHPRTGTAAAVTGIITILMTLLGWSAVPLFITHFAGSLDAWTSNGWRYGFSALVWAPVLVWGWRRRTLPPGLWRAAAVPAIVNALGQIAFAWSFYRTDPTTATFGLRLQIVFVAVGAYLMFPAERALLRRPVAWIAIALVLGGVIGTILLAPGARQQAAMHSAGVALAIAAGLGFAAYALAVRRYARGINSVIAFAAISQYTAAITVVLMLLLGHDVATGRWNAGAAALSLSPDQFALLLFSALIGIAIGHVFYYIAIARLGVAVSSGVVQLQPFLVALGAAAILGKPVTAPQMIAGLIAVAGAVLLLCVQWRLSRARK